jgi:GNAT superfamily N-acetyltransferase
LHRLPSFREKKQFVFYGLWLSVHTCENGYSLLRRFMKPSREHKTPAAVSRVAVTDTETGLSLVRRDELPIAGFDCGDADLNEWFAKDVLDSTRELVVKTFELKLPQDAGGAPIVLLSLCNDAIRLRALEEFFEVPKGKRFESWPSVKIARLGTALAHQRQGFGQEAIRLVKLLFTSNNRTGCRFLTVEAYNKPHVKHFYEANGFDYMTVLDMNAETRHMWFDLTTVEPQDLAVTG